MKLGPTHEYMIQRSKNNTRNGNSGFRRPEKHKHRSNQARWLASVFRDKEGILLVDYPEKKATITTKLHFSTN
jgi:hypothetical protein